MKNLTYPFSIPITGTIEEEMTFSVVEVRTMKASVVELIFEWTIQGYRVERSTLLDEDTVLLVFKYHAGSSYTAQEELPNREDEPTP